jgi:hypothetical protein
LPTMIVIVRRIIASEGSMSSALDRILSHGSSRTGPRGWGSWGSSGRPRAGVLGGAPAQRPSPPDGES